jgi:hypothetical protein
MIRRYARTAAAAIAVAAAVWAAPVNAQKAACPGVIPWWSGTSVIGKSAPAYEVTGASALSAVSPDGDVTFSSFGYLYATKAAGEYIEDGHPHGWIIHIDGADEGSVRKGLTALQTQLPADKLSGGAHAVLTGGWKLSVVPCAPNK